MQNRWLKGVSKRDKQALKERQELVIRSGAVFEVLMLILNSEIEDLQKARDKEDNFTLPAYSEKQAWYSGKIEGLRTIRRLISLKES